MTPGDLLVFATYITSIYKPIRHITKLSTKFSRASVSIERLATLLNIEPEIQDQPDAIAVDNLRGKIEFRDVNFSYVPKGVATEAAENIVLRDINFSILPAQSVALVGASGSGKSTIASLMLRLYDPSSGLVLVDEKDLKNYKLDTYRHQVSTVMQDPGLIGVSVRENITYGKQDATDDEVVEAAKSANAHDFIQALPAGYETVIGEGGGTLSGGQCQRIALARALIRRPAIFILDEPTSALDISAQKQIELALKAIRGKHTLVMIAHHFSLIKDFDKIIVLDRGQVVEQGSHADLMSKKGRYFQMYSEQTVGATDQERVDNVLSVVS